MGLEGDGDGEAEGAGVEEGEEDVAMMGACAMDPAVRRFWYVDWVEPPVAEQYMMYWLAMGFEIV